MKTRIAGAAPTKPRGRPRKPEDQRRVSGSLRLTRSRWVKLRVLCHLDGDWLDVRIDRAKIRGGAP